MGLQLKLYWILFFFSLLGFGQEKVTLSGVISDANNNETLIGVSVYVSELNIGAYTNEYGFYSITLPKGNYTIQVSYIGFETFSEKLEINQKDYFDDTKDEVVNIDPRILDTMVTLHFSGVTVKELEIQYNINSSIIKDNLERKGIILFDRF